MTSAIIGMTKASVVPLPSNFHFQAMCDAGDTGVASLQPQSDFRCNL